MPLVAMMITEYDYVMSIGDELGNYLGKWIAVVGNHIVAEGESGKDVYQAAKKADPKSVPFIMKVPAETVMVL